MRNDLPFVHLLQVTQLTGFSDPVYAEAYVHINQYDIVLDVLIVNQTADTLQNCTLELATLGDLKLVEKPQPVVLAPHDFCNIKANVKVASTENGFIFGNIGNWFFSIPSVSPLDTYIQRVRLRGFYKRFTYKHLTYQSSVLVWH